MRYLAWQHWLQGHGMAVEPLGADHAAPPPDAPLARRFVLWQQAVLDRHLADVFGVHALQLGFPALQALRANRMAHRWLALHALEVATTAPGSLLRCRFDELPFPDESLDLVVLPHTLDLSDNPHQLISEAYRVLRPQGRLWISGLNATSLWGASRRWTSLRARLAGQDAAQWLERIRAGTGAQALLALQPVGLLRLRDWLRLFNCEIQAGCFGQYTPPGLGARWQQRLRWLEPAGDRWWPMLGGVYAVMAIKQVPAIRWVGQRPRRRVALGGAALRPALSVPGTGA
ncbi:class I SAM-dependent methyltransferase [Amphibiibacter pelophylacis]|uniref:Class I SAM-dependent methyltransferase n=1 Tax=Amphibiibacter pelophylacis TaxID=1799477 RepID=A0ACC6P3Q4_9BURK